jgi:fermentation-respiration switch protein FrsA (DUF1100 family)
MNWLYGLLAIIALIYAIKAVILYRRQGEHVYNPRRDFIGTPADVSLAYEDIHFRAADNTLLHGWYCPGPHDSKVILLFHGNTGNISDCLESLKMFATMGYSSFVFDYRGYGHSEGQPNEQGSYHDADAAWEWLLREKRYAPDDVIVIGRSLGAAIAAHVASHHRAAAIVFESTFTSLPDIAAETHRLVPARLMTRFNYNTLARIPRIHSPILIVHGREDRVIGFHHGERLYAAANDPKAFLEIDGDHATGFINSGHKYIQGLQDFLRLHTSDNNAKT